MTLAALTNEALFLIFKNFYGQGLGWCCLFPASLGYFHCFSLKFFFNYPLTSYHWTQTQKDPAD